MARLQRSLAQCHDMVVRRSAVLEALRLRTGENVLEVGCGGGFYAHEAAQCVGPVGRVCAVDISVDQIAAARSRCADLNWVDCEVADVVKLPYGDAAFDALYGVQVFEYVATLDDALRKIRRVLRPGGRAVIFATNWSSVVWNSDQPARTKRILSAFAAHAPYPDLPATLAARLRQHGMTSIRQTPLPVLNVAHHANSFSYWLARMIASFVVGKRRSGRGKPRHGLTSSSNSIRNVNTSFARRQFSPRRSRLQRRTELPHYRIHWAAFGRR